MIIWVDLETTGLEPDTDAILELAAVATNDDLTEIGTFEAVTNEARRCALGDLHRTVQDMHLGNGLWVESLHADLGVEAACAQFKDWIIQIGGAKSPLAGSGVHFDRAFIRRHMRQAHDVLHYRNIDVSTLYETAKRFWPAVVDGGPRPDGNHRAMSDIRASIATYRYYLDSIGPVLSDDAFESGRVTVDVYPSGVDL